MFAHTDPLFKNLHVLEAEDIFKIQQFKLYYKYLIHTLPTFFLNLQFRTSEHNYNTRNQDVYKCRIRHKFTRQCLIYNIPDTIINCPTNIKEEFFTHSLQGVITYAKSSILNSYDSVCHIFLSVMFVAQFKKLGLCITTKFPTFFLSYCLCLTV